MSNVKIALAHDWLVNYAGSEQVLFYLQKLFPEAPIYTTVYEPDQAPQFKDSVIITSWLQKLPIAHHHHEILTPLMPMAINWNLDHHDVIISDSSWVMKGLKINPGTIHVCIVLTPTRWIWGYGGDNRADNLLAKTVFQQLKKWDLKAAQRPTQLVAISKVVQARIKEVYKRDSAVIYPPVDVDRFAEGANGHSPGQQGEYFLSVGRLVPYKRVDLIVQAFNQIGAPLKIIGAGPDEKKLKKMAFPNVEFLGRVDSQTRDAYYQNAKGFIFAGEEDFGIVMVEAIAAGQPVIAYQAGGALEIVKEEENGLFFPEQTVSSLVQTVQRFDKVRFKKEKLISSVKHFNPERFQKEIHDMVK